MRNVIERIRLVQVDAVNVLVRSHHLPAFSRVGPHPRDAVDRLAYERRELFEANAHAISLVTVDHHPLLRWRMEAQRHVWWEPTRAAVERARPGYVDAVVDEIRTRGPLAFTDLSDPGRHEPRQTKYADSSIAWWKWSHGKDVLTGLAATGDLAVAGRRGFEPLYDLAERVIPPQVLALPTPSEVDAHRELIHRAVIALGIGSAKEIADYYRLPVASTKARLRELVDAGSVVPATVEGIGGPMFADPSARPRPVDARAVLSPFDSLVWERKRTERLFQFKVSFEIYVKEPKRVYGYFVLPFLFGEALVGRVDLKADRKRGVLLVPGAFLEPKDEPRRKEVVAALADELRDIRRWLELDAVEVGMRGDLSAPLRRALR